MAAGRQTVQRAVFCTRKLHVSARTGTVAPLSRFFFFFLQKKNLSGRLYPFINFNQIFTDMPYITHFFQARFSFFLILAQFYAIRVPFGWAVRCECRTLLTSTTLPTFTFHFKNIPYPQLRARRPLPCTPLACTCANFSHVDSPVAMCWVLTLLTQRIPK